MFQVTFEYLYNYLNLSFRSKKNEGQPSKHSVQTEKYDINTIEEEPKVLENTATVSQVFNKITLTFLKF